MNGYINKLTLKFMSRQSSRIVNTVLENEVKGLACQGLMQNYKNQYAVVLAKQKQIKKTEYNASRIMTVVVVSYDIMMLYFQFL